MLKFPQNSAGILTLRTEGLYLQTIYPIKSHISCFLTIFILIYTGSKHLSSLTSWCRCPRFAAGVERCGTIWDPAGNANLCQ